MKIKLFLLILCSFISFTLLAQKRVNIAKVPTVVTANLKSKYPTANKVKWRAVDSLYFASFMMNDKGIDVTFKTKGDLVETMSEIDIKEIPEAVTKGVYNLFTVAKIKAAAKVEEAGKKNLYILQLKFKGRKVEMTLDEQGNQIS